MIREKGIPMYDPDNQWVDREFVKTMMRTYRLSPETLGKMAETRNMPSDSGAVRYVRPFRFTFFVLDENKEMFVDVHEPKLGMHLVHAYWKNFMCIAEAVAKELEGCRGETLPAGFQTEIAKLDRRLDILEKSLGVLQRSLKAATGVVADRLAGVASSDVRAVAVELRNLSRDL